MSETTTTRMIRRMYAAARRTVEAVRRQSEIPADAPRYRVTQNRYGYTIERLGNPTPEDRYQPPRGPWDIEHVTEADRPARKQAAFAPDENLTGVPGDCSDPTCNAAFPHIHATVRYATPGPEPVRGEAERAFAAGYVAAGGGPFDAERKARLFVSARAAGEGCPHLHQDERGTDAGLRWHCLDCGEVSQHAGIRVGEKLDAADELMSTPTICPHCGSEGTISGPYHDCKGGRCTCAKGGPCEYHGAASTCQRTTDGTPPRAPGPWDTAEYRGGVPDTRHSEPPAPAEGQAHLEGSAPDLEGGERGSSRLAYGMEMRADTLEAFGDDSTAGMLREGARKIRTLEAERIHRRAAPQGGVEERR